MAVLFELILLIPARYPGGCHSPSRHSRVVAGRQISLYDAEEVPYWQGRVVYQRDGPETSANVFLVCAQEIQWVEPGSGGGKYGAVESLVGPRARCFVFQILVFVKKTAEVGVLKLQGIQGAAFADPRGARTRVTGRAKNFGHP